MKHHSGKLSRMVRVCCVCVYKGAAEDTHSVQLRVATGPVGRDGLQPCPSSFTSVNETLVNTLTFGFKDASLSGRPPLQHYERHDGSSPVTLLLFFFSCLLRYLTFGKFPDVSDVGVVSLVVPRAPRQRRHPGFKRGQYVSPNKGHILIFICCKMKLKYVCKSFFRD